MRSATTTQGIVWKNSPIKTDMGVLHKVHIKEKQEEKKPTLLQKLGYKTSMSKDEFAKFLETATTLFDDDESPVKTQPSKDPRIAHQTQTQFDMLFASPNESFQAVPYQYEEEEEVNPANINIMDASMDRDTPVGELSTHLTEEDVDYMNIIRRITNNNKTNNGIPHPFAPVDVSTNEEDDDCRVMNQPSLHQYSFHDAHPEVNVASSIDSNTSYVREIRAKSNPLASSRDFDANSISFGGDLMQTLSQYAVPGTNESVESIDIQSIVAKNRAAIYRSKGIGVSEAQKYLDDHAPAVRPSVTSVNVTSRGASVRNSSQLNDATRRSQLAESHKELLSAMDDGLTQHWTTLQDINKEVEEYRKKGATVANFEENLQLQLDHLLSMSPQALQTIVFSQV